ncbi:hypothetical protein Dda_7241 [Drechslerella dactyloides]|uniref:Uncharacterized protein n=1 Tax=Drechslerella dactyloides TaxID=74499 RepID=A0AAD6IW29_DREDA|nr:hypothetical protein Dda_7241 [Drechslerella dactyloides]
MAQAWSSLEQGVGIIICCLPAFKTLIERRFSCGTSSNGSGGAEIEKPTKQGRWGRKNHAKLMEVENPSIKPWDHEYRGHQAMDS